MIQIQTELTVADNTGAKRVECIKLLLITFVLSVDIKIITKKEAQAYIRCF